MNRGTGHLSGAGPRIQFQHLDVCAAAERNDVLCRVTEVGALHDISGEARIRKAEALWPHKTDNIAGAAFGRGKEPPRCGLDLDDRVAEGVALAGRVRCRLVLRRAEPAIAHALSEWGLATDADGLAWRGAIAGPDRLRFLGMLARYVGVLTHIEMEEQA